MVNVRMVMRTERKREGVVRRVLRKDMLYSIVIELPSGWEMAVMRREAGELSGVRKERIVADRNGRLDEGHSGME